MVVLWRTFSRLIVLLIAAAVFAYAAAILVSAVNFYLSTQKVNAEDVRVLEELATKLDNVLQKEGTLAAAQTPIDQKNEELKTAITGLRQADTNSAVVGQLDTISANLSFLSEILKNERGKGADVVAQLKTKVTKLKGKAGPPVGADKIAATFLRDGGKILLAVIWPLLFFVILLYLLWSRSAPERLRKLLRPFKSVKLFEAELVLSDEAKTMAEGTFENYRKQAIENYDLFVQRKMLTGKFENVVSDIIGVIKNKTGKAPKQYRCTLYVPDLVFADTLYQLLDYIPSGAGRGRIFSIRYGIVGRVWRSRTSDIEKFILIPGKGVVDQNELVRAWGMSRREAQTAAEGRPSFLCVMLSNAEGDPVGLFYMDSKDETAFQISPDENLGEMPGKIATNEMLDEITTKFSERKIIEILAKMSDELGGHAPLIRIYEK
jgi:hypothetical protein